MFGNRSMRTSLTRPRAAAPKHQVRRADAVAEPVRNRPMLTAGSLLASPRAWLMGAPGSVAVDSPTAGATYELAHTDRAAAGPVRVTCLNVRARGPEGVASRLRISDAAERAGKPAIGSGVDHIKANVFASWRESRSLGGGLVGTLADSKDPHLSHVSYQQPTTEADYTDVRPQAQATHDTDVISERARNVDRRVSEREPLEEVADNPNTRDFRPTLDGTDLAAISLDESAPSDSGVGGIPTPEPSCCTRGGENSEPTSETQWDNKSSYWLYGDGFLGGRSAHLRARHRRYYE